jgi:hypothetical protein
VSKVENKHRAAVQLGRLGGKARAARMSKTELSEAGRKAASAPRVCVCGHWAGMHAVGVSRECLETIGAADDVFCACHVFTPRPSRRKAKVEHDADL